MIHSAINTSSWIAHSRRRRDVIYRTQRRASFCTPHPSLAVFSCNQVSVIKLGLAQRFNIHPCILGTCYSDPVSDLPAQNQFLGQPSAVLGGETCQLTDTKLCSVNFRSLSRPQLDTQWPLHQFIHHLLVYIHHPTYSSVYLAVSTLVTVLASSLQANVSHSSSKLADPQSKPRWSIELGMSCTSPIVDSVSPCRRSRMLHKSLLSQVRMIRASSPR